MRTYLLLSCLALAGCGSSAPKAEAPKSAPSESPAEGPPEAGAKPGTDDAKEDEASKKIPDACAPDAKDGCVMPSGFVQRLCSGSYPDLALMFFQKGSPWRRAYVAVKEAAA